MSQASRSEYAQRVLLIVPAVDRQRVNQIARSWDPAGGDATFTVGYSPTGRPPVTHYVACGAVTEELRAAIQAARSREFPLGAVVTYDPEDTGFPRAELARRFLKPVED